VATPRSQTPRRAPPSCTHCAPSLTRRPARRRRPPHAHGRAHPPAADLGERDSVIPIAHGRAAHAMVPGSRFEVFADSGHFPQLDEPERVIEVLGDFVDATEPATFDADQWRELFKGP